VSQDEKAGLVSVPQANVDVASAIPELTWVEKGPITGAYVLKDGILIYHIYKTDRKAIYDQANADMDQMRDRVVDQKERARLQSEIAVRANTAMAQVPWWPNIMVTLEQVFEEHFRHQPKKVSYYEEVDSCSVILPEPAMPAAKSKAHLEALFSKLALALQG